METRKGPRSMPKHARTWEIWNYYKLRDSGTLARTGRKFETGCTHFIIR